jgi:hypothetical protein
MAKSKNQKKKRKKTVTRMRTRLILPGEDIPEEEDIDENEGGMFLGKEDVRLIYNAMKHYKPSQEEESLHSMLLESFEEMLVVDYDEKLPGFEFLDEEENEK